MLSYKFFKMLRLYGGGGYLFDQEPADLRPWTTQYGVELESPWKLGSNAITPIFAGDFKNDEKITGAQISPYQAASSLKIGGSTSADYRCSSNIFMVIHLTANFTTGKSKLLALACICGIEQWVSWRGPVFALFSDRIFTE